MAMDDPEYLQGQKSLTLLASMIAQIDLPGMLERIRVAEDAGPILDPSLYRRAEESMANVRELVNAAMPLWHEVRRHQLRAQERKAMAEGNG